MSVPLREQSAGPETPGLTAPKPALWSTAPAWRNLTIGSCLLTSMAISAPIVLPRLQTAPATLTQQACTAKVPGSPEHLRARVTGFVSEAEALAITRTVEAEVGAQVSPAYRSLRRVYVEVILPTGARPTMAAVPEYMTVQIGDILDVNSRYRDPSLPCHFIPWTIYRLAGRPG